MRRSLVLDALTAALVVVLLVAMLVLNELVGDAIFAVYRHGSGVLAWPYFLAG